MIELLSNTGFIMYNKRLAHLLGINSAILLGELCAKYQYWLERGELLENSGWFFATQGDIQADTALSPKQQRLAMQSLVDAGIVRAQKMGLPAKMYYQISEEEVNNLLCRKVTTVGAERSPQCVTKGNIYINRSTKKETKKETKISAPDMTDQNFEAFWQVYPKKHNRAATMRVWVAMRPDEELAQKIILAVERAAKTKDWQKEGGKYIPSPARYLEDRRWEDCITPASKQGFATSFDVAALDQRRTRLPIRKETED